MKLNYVSFDNSAFRVFITLVVIVFLSIFSVIAYQEGKEFFIVLGSIIGGILTFFCVTLVVHILRNYFHRDAVYERAVLKARKKEEKEYKAKRKEFEEIWE